MGLDQADPVQLFVIPGLEGVACAIAGALFFAICVLIANHLPKGK